MAYRVEKGGKKKSYSDTREIFDSIFGRALRALLKKEKIQKAREKYAKPRRVSNISPISHPEDNRAGPDGRDTEEKTFRATEKETSSPAKDDELGIAALRTDAKARQRRRRKIASGKRAERGAKKLGWTLACVLLAAMLGTATNYYGIVDFGKAGSSLRSIKKENIRPIAYLKRLIGSLDPKVTGNILADVRRKEPVRSKGKPPQLASKSPQKSAKVPRPAAVRPEKKRHIIRKPVNPATHIKKVEKRDRVQKVDPLPAKPPLSYPYSIYLGSYRTLDRARKAISKHEREGFSPYWVKVDLGEKGIWFRVFTGYFRSRKEAEAYIEEKQIAEAKARNTKYANLVGIYKSPDELRKKRRKLSNYGFSPYLVPGKDGESLLYAGAFYKRTRAAQQHADLASRGIRNRLVER